MIHAPHPWHRRLPVLLHRLPAHRRGIALTRKLHVDAGVADIVVDAGVVGGGAVAGQGGQEAEKRKFTSLNISKSSASIQEYIFN